MRASLSVGLLFALLLAVLLTTTACNGPSTVVAKSRTGMSMARANAVFSGFSLALDSSAFVRSERPKLKDAWRVAGCVVRQPAFWDVADTLRGDRSSIVVRGTAGSIRQLAAVRYLRWRRLRQQHVPRQPALVVSPVGLPQRRPFEKFSATTEVNGHIVKLRRWQLSASIEELAATLVHEWLHTLGFRDPAAEGDRRSVVYGTQEVARSLASTDKCQRGLTAFYITP